jgi:RNA polymerase sigma factor (sigma-70 family)
MPVRPTSPAMDEVQEFCSRVIGASTSAREAAAQARAGAGEDRIELLAAATRECRRRADGQDGHAPPPGPSAESRHDDGGGSPPGGSAESPGLAASIAQELALATARMPEREREVLALRELLRLSYQQISRVMGIEPAAVARLLARARLRLRAERRGSGGEQDAECDDRERSLRVLACRQDSEPLSAEDDAWVLAHMGQCRECETAHAAMLEASVCYRAWPRA